MLEASATLSKTVVNAVSQYRDRPVFGWLMSDGENHCGVGGNMDVCKAYLSDDYFRNPRFRAYIVASKALPSLRRLRTYLRSWEYELGLSMFSAITAYDNVAAFRIRPDKSWLYGPGGIQTHTFLVRTGWLWDGITDPLTWPDVMPNFTYRTDDHASWVRAGKRVLTNCVATKTLPFPHGTWDRYTSVAVTHNDGLTSCSIKEQA